MRKGIMRILLVMFGFLTLVAGQGKPISSRTPALDAFASPTVTNFFVDGMSCPNCSKNAIEALRQIPNVLEINIDFKSRQASIKTGRLLPKEEIRKKLGMLELDARFEGDPVVAPLSSHEKVSLDIKAISTGEAIRLQSHLASGKITIFDYHAEWCGPCHLLSPKLERLLLKYPSLSLRKIDIGNWESDVAKQATKEFGIPGLPYVRLYGPDGRFLGEVQGNKIEQVEAIIRENQKL